MTEPTEKKTDALDVEPSGTLGVAAVAAQPPRVRFAALDVPVFRWYWVTSWISSTGDGMENVIRNVLVRAAATVFAALALILARVKQLREPGQS